MSLITRCPACRTMFKVVADQLRVSGGWVRCGYCSDVFDASANLQTQPPAQTVSSSQPIAAPAAPVSPAPGPARSTLSPHQPDESLALPDISSLLENHPLTEEVEPLAELPRITVGTVGFDSRPVAETQFVAASDGLRAGAAGSKLEGNFLESGTSRHRDGIDAPKLAFDSLAINQVDVRSGLQANAAVPGESDRAATLPGQSARRAEGTEDSPAGEVTFVRDALRKEFWRKPLIRVALGFFGFMLLLAMLFQVVLHQKDTMAALEPRLKPVLQRFCAELGCEVAPLKRIEVLVIESSSFNKLSADSYRLSFIIKNRAPLDVAMPSLELTLTDNQENPVLRRVLLPPQFGAGSTLLPAGGEFAGMVAFQLSDGEADTATAGAPLRVAGYRVLAFYP